MIIWIFANDSDVIPNDEDFDAAAEMFAAELPEELVDNHYHQSIRLSELILKAENGLKALEQLHQVKDIDLVVCDLEMPYMNGFQFLKAVYQHPDFSKIPVIMLTSRDSDKHRQLAIQLGATTYLNLSFF